MVVLWAEVSSRLDWQVQENVLESGFSVIAESMVFFANAAKDITVRIDEVKSVQPKRTNQTFVITGASALQQRLPITNKWMTR